MEKNKFYDEAFKPFQSRNNVPDVDLSNPYEIYEYLKKNVYKQDNYCMKAAMLLYNHARGVRSRVIVCGPPGNGKTLVAEQIRTLWPKTIIVNAATITKEGWTGNIKVSSFLELVNPTDPSYIVVFDEFDKIIQPHHTSDGENVSAYIQSEFLKLVEGQVTKLPGRDSNRFVDTSKMSFMFCGSFAAKADEIARSNSVKTIGFTAQEHIEEPYDKELTLNDIVDFGLIPEIASRSTDVINVRPLTLRDYMYLIAEHEASPVKKIEQEYGLKIDVSSKMLKKIATEAYKSRLGVRYANSRIRRMVDAELFPSFEKNGETLTTVSL